MKRTTLWKGKRKKNVYMKWARTKKISRLMSASELRAQQYFVSSSPARHGVSLQKGRWGIGKHSGIDIFCWNLIEKVTEVEIMWGSRAWSHLLPQFYHMPSSPSRQQNHHSAPTPRTIGTMWIPSPYIINLEERGCKPEKRLCQHYRFLCSQWFPR